jgi:hypothetical protein
VFPCTSCVPVYVYVQSLSLWTVHVWGSSRGGLCALAPPRPVLPPLALLTFIITFPNPLVSSSLAVAPPFRGGHRSVRQQYQIRTMARVQTHGRQNVPLVRLRPTRQACLGRHEEGRREPHNHKPTRKKTKAEPNAAHHQTYDVRINLEPRRGPILHPHQRQNILRFAGRVRRNC